MLDAADLQAIANLISSSEKRLTERIDELSTRVDKLEVELTERVDKLEAEFTERIDKLSARMDRMEAEFTERIDKLEAEFNERINKLEAELTERIDKLETELYDEMGRYDKQNQRSFNELRSKMDRFESTYRISKTESDTIVILSKNIHDIQERFSKLNCQRAQMQNQC